MLWWIKKKQKKTKKVDLLNFPGTTSIFPKDKINIDKTRAKEFFLANNIKLLSNGNIKAEHLGIKKFHLNRKSNVFLLRIYRGILRF